MQVDREIIDGKPHFGIWVGYWLFINSMDKSLDYYTSVLRSNKVEGLEERYEQLVCKPIIERFPFYFGKCTLGRKYVLWGRAYKVMAHFKKGVRRSKKIWINGHRKRVKVN